MYIIPSLEKVSNFISSIPAYELHLLSEMQAVIPDKGMMVGEFFPTIGHVNWINKFHIVVIENYHTKELINLNHLNLQQLHELALWLEKTRLI